MTRFAAIQMCSTADVVANNAEIDRLVRQAAGQGAQVVSLPEAANLLLRDQFDYPAACRTEDEDSTLALCRALAAELGIWLHTGSLLLRQAQGDRIHNRAHMIARTGGSPPATTSCIPSMWPWAGPGISSKAAWLPPARGAPSPARPRG